MADYDAMPPPPVPQRPSHQRSKSSVLLSFMGHKRNNSDGEAISAPFPLPVDTRGTASIDLGSRRFMPESGQPIYPRYHNTLGELPQNQQDQAPRSPTKPQDSAPPSPQKSSFATISLKQLTGRESLKLGKSKDGSSTKPKKVKSVTNLGGLLSRPKSIKSFKQLITDEESRRAKDKENRTPPGSIGEDHNAAAAPPIYAQFSSQQQPADCRDQAEHRPQERPGAKEARAKAKPRPKSWVIYGGGQDNTAQLPDLRNIQSNQPVVEEKPQKRRTWGKQATTARPSLKHAFSGLALRTKTSSSSVMTFADLDIDPKDIDKHLEALLDRRNIPENQRYKMRNLNNTIKLEFIRQDWAETQQQLESPVTNDRSVSVESAGTGGSDQDGSNSRKHNARGRALTLARGGNKDKSKSPHKKSKAETSLGRHFRTKSTDSFATDCPTSTVSSSFFTGGLIGKAKGQQMPCDFVAYLRKVQKPELVEVGKLHKLRLLLRNETVAWTEEFIGQGGMKEIVELLHRIMAVEWR